MYINSRCLNWAPGSCRSTKLIHGGVRYLQKAIMRLDYEQYAMVKEALHERANLLDIAPHLSFPLPIMLPVYKWWQVISAAFLVINLLGHTKSS